MPSPCRQRLLSSTRTLEASGWLYREQKITHDPKERVDDIIAGFGTVIGIGMFDSQAVTACGQAKSMFASCGTMEKNAV